MTSPTMRAEALWNVNAERSCIGAVMLDPTIADHLELEANDFADRQLGAAWAAIMSLRAVRSGIDPVTVVDAATSIGHVLTFATLSECVSSVPTSANADRYAAIVKDSALTRRVHVSVKACLDSGDTGEALLESLYASLSGLYARRGDASVLMSELVTERVRDLSVLATKRQQGEALVLGVPTGLRTLDETLGGGLALGGVTVLGGRTRQGKSALGLSITLHATSAGYPAHVFSLEDDRDSYGDRALSIRGNLRLHELRMGRLDAPATGKMFDAAQSLGGLANWRIDDGTRLSSAQIAMRVRKHKRTLGTKLVVVDFMQLMREDGRDMRERINAAMEGLVHLARSEDVAVLAMSQLSRANEKENRPPELRDLKESGQLEEYARAVLLLWRWEENGKARARVHVAKQKHGRGDTMIQMEFDAPSVTFREAFDHSMSVNKGRG